MKIINKTVCVLLVVVMLLPTMLLTGCGGKKLPPMADPIDDNYRTFYQIFVGSFSDSNGDGIGDLRGIINRFDYLNDGNINSGESLGVQGIWLSPIFQSPSYHKYDASDYYKVDKKFGTEEDLKELIALCHERNVKIILDLVINHTASSNDWFEEFFMARVNNDTENKYYDYYTCVTEEEKVGGRTYLPMANSGFYYECNFSGNMPELNFDNPDVRADMLSLAKYYLDLGVDGFRFDAVKYIYFGDTKKSVDFWKWYMSELEAYKPDIYCVGECWSGESEILEYYEAMNCFDFAVSSTNGKIVSAARGNNGLASYISYVESYQDKVTAVNSQRMPMPFLSNHDQDRSAGALVENEKIKMAANLFLLTPGSPMMYYGEEIGIRGSRGSANTDANRRLAMLWGDGDTIKNPTGSTYSSKHQITETVADQLKDEDSVLRHYQQVIAVRNKYTAIARGDYNAVFSSNDNVGGFYVEYNGEILGIIHNASEEKITINISELEGLDGHTFTQLCEVLGASAKLKGDKLVIEARTTVILK